PDNLLTLEDGKIIANECSTQKNYWKQKKDLNKWKPCADINKCIEKCKNNLKEIILCSNQEQPGLNPCLDSEIIKFARNKTSAKITIFDCAKIEDIISENIQNSLFGIIIENYFPKLYEILEVKEPIKQMIKTLENSMLKKVNFNNESLLLKKEINIEGTKYQRYALPCPGEVTRILPDDFCILKPIGSIYTLLGIPKIGKTSLMAKLAKIWQKQQIEVKWYDCPPDKEEISEMINALSMNICKKYLLPNKYLELKEGNISIYSLGKEFIQKQS
ncbi:unnamed protein product, partial [marine sediment metagenome]